MSCGFENCGDDRAVRRVRPPVAVSRSKIRTAGSSAAPPPGGEPPEVTT
jgi:hypothetical protein